MGKNLTDISIRNLKPGAARLEIRDGGARGLYLVVQPSGVKSFAVRYRFNGKPQKLTLGRWQEPADRQRVDEAAEPKIGETLSLASARKLAADTLLQTGRGRNPSAAKRLAKQKQRLAAGNNLEAVAEEYLKRECGMKRNAEGRPTFASGKLRSGPWRCAVLERLVYPTLGDYPITEIKRSDLIRLLDRIEAGELKDKDGALIRGGSTMADRTLAIIRKILNWHAIRSDDFRSPIVRGMARVKPKERARKRTLTDDEIRLVWKTADKTPGPFGALLQFLLLTAARRNEAADMERTEVAAAAKPWKGTAWTLPASRNKAKVDLVRPLSDAAMDALAKAPKLADCKFVFTTDGKNPISGFSRFKKNFDTACGVSGWTLHDLRRTARSLMSRAGANADHAELCLGHVIGGVRETYDRHEFYAERQKVYEALAAQLRSIVEPAPANVVSIAEARG